MERARLIRTYAWMAHVYDPLFARSYRRLRRQVFDGISPPPEGCVLVVGAGTGLDLGYLTAASQLLAVDLSASMLRRASKKPGARVAAFVLADGESLPLRTASVDFVVLHLVLSVAPDGRRVLEECLRVLAPDGRISVLDHFAPASGAGPVRRLASRADLLFGTHFDRTFEELASGLPVRVERDRRFALGSYRAILLAREAARTR